MTKKLLALALACALTLGLCTGCSPSPTAVIVGDNEVDASEYAFYLNHNRSNTGEDSGSVLYDEAANQLAQEYALSQIVTNEVVRLKCEELELELTDQQQSELRVNKDHLIESLGGKAAYLEYLRQSQLTDRGYDKFQENRYYFKLLYDYVAQDSQNHFTDEALRQYFSENYATVKYIFLSFTSEEGDLFDKEVRREILKEAELILKAARADGADFNALMAQHNQDVSMTAEGFPISRMEAESTEYLTGLFELAENEVGDLYIDTDGCYIVKRCPVPASYFDENHADIFLQAQDGRFSELLEQWKGEYTVQIKSIVHKIDLSNLSEYVK